MSAAVTVARMSEEAGPRFSLPVNEGAGAMLGVAVGDAAGGDFDGGYAASTQQALVVAYHLLGHGALDREILLAELVELDGDTRDPSVLRKPSGQLRDWIDSVHRGEPEYRSDPGMDPIVRVTPIGMWYRRRPDELIEAALECARVTHLDGPTAVIAAATAGAVAAACFAQNGRDMLMAVIDVAIRAARMVEEEPLRYAHLDQVAPTLARLRGAVDLTDLETAELADATGSDPVGRALAGLVLGTVISRDPEQVLADAARVGGSPLGAMVGGIAGARVGIRRWPWEVPNDTWFVALGQRLVEGRADLIDLPVPYAVEQRVTYLAPDQRL
jgi:ADP-ribosylglycohydrolase